MLPLSKSFVPVLWIAMLANQVPPAAIAQSAKTPPPIRAEFRALVPDSTIFVSGPVALASGAGSLWLVDPIARSITRRDPATTTVTQTVAGVEAPCAHLTFGFEAMWVAACGGGGVIRVDPKTNAAEALLAGGTRSLRGSLVTAVGSLWALTDDHGVLARIDPETHAVVAEVYVGEGATDLAAAQDRIWATVPSTGMLVKVNAHTHVIEEQIKVGASPQAVAAGEGGVWTFNTGDGSVSRVDPGTSKVVATVTLGAATASGTIAVGEGSVWVSAPGLPLARIDPRTNRLVQVFAGPEGGTVFVAGGSVWVMADATSLWRLDPRRIEATR